MLLQFTLIRTFKNLIESYKSVQNKGRWGQMLQFNSYITVFSRESDSRSTDVLQRCGYIKTKVRLYSKWCGYIAHGVVIFKKVWLYRTKPPINAQPYLPSPPTSTPF